MSIEKFADVVVKFAEYKKNPRHEGSLEGDLAWFALDDVDSDLAARLTNRDHQADPWGQESATGFWSWLATEYGVI